MAELLLRLQLLYLVNWKKDKTDKSEIQFTETMSRQRRTWRCELLELHGGRTF